jgi:Tol biopolymer transport system component
VTTVVSVKSSGTQGSNNSFSPSISADGRYVAFESLASDLIANDTNGGVRDIFVHDRNTGVTTVVSVKSSGTQGSNNNFSPSVSADGRYVAFESLASDLIANDTNGGVRDIFVHDRNTGSTTVVSVDSNGTQGSDDSSGPSISGDGNYISFESLDNSLVLNDSNGFKDVFVRGH